MNNNVQVTYLSPCFQLFGVHTQKWHCLQKDNFVPLKESHHYHLCFDIQHLHQNQKRKKDRIWLEK